MKRTNGIGSWKERIVAIAADRRERRSCMIVIVPHVFMQPAFGVPIIRTSRSQSSEASLVEDEVLAAIDTFLPDPEAA
jgi:hypothetical protein